MIYSHSCLFLCAICGVIKEAMKKIIFSIITFCISLILLLVSSELLLRFTGHQPWSYKVRSNEPVMFKPDQVFGWKNKEGSYIYPAYVPTGKDIKVTSLADGSRITSEIAVEADERDKFIIVGGSFTQGLAISDHETFPWKLQGKYPFVKVLNYGTSGYGTYQSLLVLENFFKNSESPAMVLYGFIDNHEKRNVATPGRLKGIRSGSRRRGGHVVYLPYCTINNHGTLVRESPISYPPIWSLSKSLATANFFQYHSLVLKSLRRRFQRRLVTEKLLLEMNRLSKENGTIFMVALLHFGDNPKQKSHYINFLEKNHIEAVDCVYPMTPEMKVKGEGHPNGKMNTLWANCIAKAIGDSLN